MKLSKVPILSIVIPCYNVSMYLDRCLKDLVNLPYELILIDDGSTDSTPEICDSYNENENVKVFHKVNGGLSDARNFGLERANGEYVIFVDSDDYIDVENLNNTLEILINSGVDMVYCDFSKQSITNRVVKIDLLQNEQIYSGRELLDVLLSRHMYYPMVWKNIYRKEFIIENNLFFKKGYLHEDEDWMIRCLFCVSKVLYYPESFYIYCINDNSITHKKNEKNLQDVMEIVISLKKQLEISTDNSTVLINEYLNNLYLASYIQSSKRNIMKIEYSDINSVRLKIKYILCKYFKPLYRKIYLMRVKKFNELNEELR